MLLWLQGLNEDNKDGFCGHRVYGTNMMATWGKPRTTRVLCWLQRLTEYQHGGFLCPLGIGLGHKEFDGYMEGQRPPGPCCCYRCWQRTMTMAFGTTGVDLRQRR